MNDLEHFHVQMDRKIFELDLPVTQTSAYILIASLMEQNIRPSINEITSRWTGSAQDLSAALDALAGRNIIKRTSNYDKTEVYLANPSSLWR